MRIFLIGLSIILAGCSMASIKKSYPITDDWPLTVQRSVDQSIKLWTEVCPADEIKPDGKGGKIYIFLSDEPTYWIRTVLYVNTRDMVYASKLEYR